jgi:hypothetical protein
MVNMKLPTKIASGGILLLSKIQESKLSLVHFSMVLILETAPPEDNVGAHRRIFDHSSQRLKAWFTSALSVLRVSSCEMGSRRQ